MIDNLVKKFFLFSYGSVVVLIIGLANSMITTRVLSPEIFGKATMYTLAVNIAVILISFGTDQSFVRFFYEEEEAKRSNLLYSCLKLPLMLSIVFTLLVSIFWGNVTLYLFEDKSFALAVLLVLGVYIFLINRFSILVIRMQQKGKLYSNIQIVNKVFSLFFILLMYFVLGERYEVIILSTVLAMMVTNLIALYKEKEFWHFSRKSSPKTKFQQIEIIKYSYPLVFTTIIAWLFQSFDKIALREWSTFTEVGLYSAAIRIIALINVLQASFTTFWTPVCYEHYEKSPNDTSLYVNVSKMVSFVMFSVGIVSIAGKDIMALLLGEEYRATANIMPFLVFIPVLYTISETTVIGINFAKKTKWHILIAGVSCTFNLVGNILLVPTHGAIGASIATALSYVVFLTMRTTISLKFYKVNYGLKRMYVLITVIMVYAVFSIINNSFAMNVIFGFVAQSLLIFLYKDDLIIFYNEYIKLKLSRVLKNEVGGEEI